MYNLPPATCCHLVTKAALLPQMKRRVAESAIIPSGVAGFNFQELDIDLTMFEVFKDGLYIL